MKKALLIFASLLLAALLQQLLGMGLLWLSDVVPDDLGTQLGMAGFWLMPLSPFFAGVYWLPLTSFLMYWAINSARKP